jgi:uncharacterized protein YndB with AHSA1/START domain
MPAPHDPGHSGDHASVRIAAPADRIYALVSDPGQLGRLSPECVGGRWLGGATGPAVGARFKGRNKRGIARWSTTNEVVAADPGRAFAFRTQQSGVEWRYALEADGDGTVVTESRAEFKARPVVAKLFTRFALGGVEAHEDELRAGMEATLERLKAVAEADA